MTKAAGFLGTAILAAWGTTACALGLGDISVSSALNQRFHAVIPLTSATPDELQTLQVQVASNDEFAREGIERSDYLSSLSFEVVTEGQPRIIISSSQVAQDPALTFIVDAHWASGRLLKEYTALLDFAPAEPVKTPGVPSGETALTPTPLPSHVPAAAPTPSSAATPPPETKPAPVHKPVPQHKPVVKPKPVEHAPTPAAPQAEASAPTLAAPSSPAVGEGKYYGPVEPQETLWHIASKLRPDVSVSMDQTMAALYAANPTAFHNGLNVIKGARLRVPTMEEIRANSPADATRALEEIRHGGKPSLSAAPSEQAMPAEAAPAPKPVKPAKAPVSKPTPKPAPAEAPAAKAPPPTEVLPPPPSVAPAQAPKEAAPAPATPPPAASSAAAASSPAPAATEQNATPAPSAASTAAAPAPVAEKPQVKAPKQAPLAPPPAPESNLPIPLLGGLGAVLAALVGFFLWRRSNNAKSTPAPKSAPARTAPPKFEPVRPPEPPVAREPEEEAAAPNPAAHEDTTTLTQDVSLDSTATLEEPSITLEQAPGGQKDKEIDFDITSQIEAQTVPISLEANDPISEADFHLAYGLYDEAILLLKEAIQKDPARNELRMKLAETYFAAGRPLEFQEAAEPLKGKVPAADWQKLAIMGRQICPDSPLFQEDAHAPAEEAASVDFAFTDEPPTVAAPASAPAPAAMTPGSNVIDFDADALSTGRPDSLVGNMSSASEGAGSSDIDLSQFDLSNEPAAETGAHAAAKAPAPDGSVEFNLDELDLGKPNAFMPAKGEAGETGEPVDFGDEVSTKLDLARAYVDMGDNEAARSLLNEVLAGGNSAQKQEAETLLKRLSA